MKMKIVFLNPLNVGLALILFLSPNIVISQNETPLSADCLIDSNIKKISAAYNEWARGHEIMENGCNRNESKEKSSNNSTKDSDDEHGLYKRDMNEAGEVHTFRGHKDQNGDILWTEMKDDEGKGKKLKEELGIGDDEKKDKSQCAEAINASLNIGKTIEALPETFKNLGCKVWIQSIDFSYSGGAKQWPSQVQVVASDVSGVLSLNEIEKLKKQYSSLGSQIEMQSGDAGHGKKLKPKDLPNTTAEIDNAQNEPFDNDGAASIKNQDGKKSLELQSSETMKAVDTNGDGQNDMLIEELDNGRRRLYLDTDGDGREDMIATVDNQGHVTYSELNQDNVQLINPVLSNNAHQIEQIIQKRQTIVDVANSFAIDPNVAHHYSTDTELDNFKEGDPKCNKFVYDVLKEAGINPGTPNGKYADYGLGFSPPTANQWGDPAYNIQGWRVLAPGEAWLPGDVISKPMVGLSGHVGIYLGNGQTASASVIENKVVINDYGFRPLDKGKIIVRRYDPD